MKLSLLSFAILTSLSPLLHAENYEENNGNDYLADFYGSEEFVEIATGIKTQIYKAPAVANVISAEQIKTMGATDIDDVLETVPGLHISRSPIGYNPIYSFRGVHSAYNSQVLMLINGIPITNDFVGDRSQVWGGMPVEAIARIEVIRGPGSALFGADAFAGVINIITKNADDIKKNEISLRGGDNSTRDAWFALAHKQGQLNVSGIFEYHKTDGIDKLIEEDAQTINDQAFGTNVSNAPGNVNTQTENFDFRGELNYADFTLRTGYQLRNNTGIGAGLGEALDPDAKQRSERFNLDLTYQMQLTEHLELTGQAAYFSTNQEIKNNYLIYPEGADIGFGAPFTDGFIGNPEHWEQHARINVAGEYSGFNKHNIRLGVGYNTSDLYRTKETKNFGFGPTGEFIIPGSPLVDVSDTPYVYLHETDRINRYIFVQDMWNFANDWELTAGVRHDNYSDFGSTTNPRLALVWSTSLNLSTKLLYGQAFRAPSYVDSGNINNPVALGNPEIQPEKMKTTELAFDYHPGLGFGAILSFYHYTWDDIIQYIPDADVGGNKAQNFGKQTAYGSEFELNWQATDTLFFAGNYSFSKATNERTDTDVAYVPEQQLFLQVNWHAFDNVKVNFRNNYVAQRQRASGDMREKIDNYWISDITVRWTSSSLPIEVAVIAKNIFDEDAREPSFNNGALVNLPNDLPLAGRSIYGEVRYNF